MAIKINDKAICFGSFSIKPTSDGICIDGVFSHQGTRVLPTQAQGTDFGFAGTFNVPLTNTGQIEKWPFASDTNSTCIGSFTDFLSSSSSSSSSTHGYLAAGYKPPVSGAVNVIEKFPFASGGAAADVGDTCCLTLAAGGTSTESGYSAGGYCYVPTTTKLNIISKFPFAADSNATDVGDLTQARYGLSGISSIVSGYAAGGYVAPYVNTIDKYPFSSDTNATDVGDLSYVVDSATGAQSLTDGYIAGGIYFPGSNARTNILKFPFATDTGSTNVGYLTTGHRAQSSEGSSSVEYGYIAGGVNPTIPTVRIDVIEKWPFASDGNATDVGNLSTVAIPTGGFQV